VNTSNITDALYRRIPVLQYRDFRLIWFGQTISTVGSEMQLIAVNWHVYELLKDRVFTISLLGSTAELDAGALALGMLGVVRVFPIIVFALLGGIVADTADRRRVLLWTQSIAMFFAAALALVSLGGDVNVAWLYLLTAAGAATAAFDNPARQSLVPNLVPREHLANAVSLNTITWHIGTIIGPAVAGVMVAHIDIGYVYAVNAVSFGAAIVSLAMIRYRGKVAATNTGMGWGALVDGLKFTYRSRIIWSTMLLDFFATFFSSARTMLPIVADQILGVGSQGYGLLATAQPAGALIAGIVLSLRKREIHRQGVVLLASVAIYGAATAMFGVSTLFALSYVLFGLTGTGDTVSTVIRGTIRQVMTPDYLRGRMVSVNMVFFMGGPQLGELEAGLVAAAFGAPLAIFTGGVATVLLTGWIAWKYPRLRRYTRDTQNEYLQAAAS
jgi:MFS family permease